MLIRIVVQVMSISKTNKDPDKIAKSFRNHDITQASGGMLSKEQYQGMSRTISIYLKIQSYGISEKKSLRSLLNQT
jgi:hypothetical protein